MNQRRFRTRNSQKGKLTLRTLLATCIVGSAVALSGLMLLVNIFNEDSKDSQTSPMVISGIKVSQDTGFVFRGSAMQVMLQINITTKGRSNKLNLNSFELSSRGTSLNNGDLVDNVRLWSTGNTPNFTPSRQAGITLNFLPKENYNMNVVQPLEEGDNYFWLTYDIGKSPGGKSMRVDAECLSAMIGTLKYDNDSPPPRGVKRVAENIPYFSSGNGDISNLKIWNTRRDGSGASPASFSSPNATYNIQPGHILSNALNACLQAVIIERNGVLRSTATLNANLLEVQGGATFIQAKNFRNQNALHHFVIRNGGNYVHQFIGSIPGTIKEFEPNSVVILNDYNEDTFAEKITWGNLVFNSQTAGDIDVGNSFKNIRGDLEIRNTGKEGYIYSSSTDSVHVGGNLVVNGGRFIMAAKNNHLNLIVAKKILLNKGWISDKLPGTDAKGSATIFIGAGIDLRQGIFKLTSANSKIIIRNPKCIWYQLDAEVMLSSIELQPGSELVLKGIQFGPVGKSCMLTVMNNARLNCDKIIVTGPGGFALNDFATITTSHPDGINTDNNKGSIQTATKIFSSYADYIYTGSETPQKSGVFITKPIQNTVNNLIIHKDKLTDVLVLEQNIFWKENLVKDRGNINRNSFRLAAETKSEAALIIH